LQIFIPPSLHLVAGEGVWEKAGALRLGVELGFEALHGALVEPD
jgi:hypothetical protein